MEHADALCRSGSLADRITLQSKTTQDKNPVYVEATAQFNDQNLLNNPCPIFYGRKPANASGSKPN